MTSSCNDDCSNDGCSKETKTLANSLNETKPFMPDQNDDPVFASLLSASKMDCPSEENTIRLALNNVSQIKAIEFDLGKRQFKLFHLADTSEILHKLEPLDLDITLIETSAFTDKDKIPTKTSSEIKQETRALYWLLTINGVMFCLELGLGLIAQSAGLIADSLDMFADAAVYGLALYAVGRSSRLQVKAAHFSGWVQILLATGLLIEVGRRFIYGSEPQSPLMMSVGVLALIANISCLMLIHRHREGGAHMKASWIFSANDVIANLGVIVAGALVAWTGSRYPDLIIGIIIGLIVLNGAKRILQIRA